MGVNTAARSSGSVGTGGTASLSEVLTTATTRPAGSPGMARRLTWSSDISGPDISGVAVQVLPVSVRRADQVVPVTWLLHSIVVTPSADSMVEMSSASSVVAAAESTGSRLSRTGTVALPKLTVPASAEPVVRATRSWRSRVQVAQMRPESVCAIVSDSDDVPVMSTGNPASGTHPDPSHEYRNSRAGSSADVDVELAATACEATNRCDPFHSTSA